MKIKIFENTGLWTIEREVNEFINNEKITVINQSITMTKDGYVSRYVISVLYDAK